MAALTTFTWMQYLASNSQAASVILCGQPTFTRLSRGILRLEDITANHSPSRRIEELQWQHHHTCVGARQLQPGIARAIGKIPP